MYQIDETLCNGCGNCASVCPAECIGIIDGKAKYNSSGICIFCGHCYAVCPLGVINEKGDQSIVIPEGEELTVEIPSYGKLIDFLRSRRSIRVYQKKNIESEIVEKLVDAARWAPTGNNQRNLRVVIIGNKEKLQLFKDETIKMLRLCQKLNRFPALLKVYSIIDSSASTLVGEEIGADIAAALIGWEQGNDSIFHGAPMVIIVHEPKNDTTPKDNGVYAMYNMILAAQTLGLGTCICGWAQAAMDRSKAIRSALGIPMNNTITQVAAVGYPATKYKRLPPRPVCG